MEKFLPLFILLPACGFLLSLFVPRKREKILSGFAIGLIGVHLLGVFAYMTYWFLHGHPTLDLKHFVLYKTNGFEFFIDFYFDKITATYILIGTGITFMVAIFSRYYLHREEGFKRFFNTVLFFFLGYNIVVFAGNFETLFIGWEFLGLSSFLLIAFYRDRYLPVRNGLKVISVYRLGDICLMLAMWMSHHLWKGNVTFANLNHAATIQQHLQDNYWATIFIALMILVAAATKSAQLPFSSWLPRAMEGPTSSSAIFYGSLSVHLGVFLLLRTYPFWEMMLPVKLLIIGIGLLTAIVATNIARVQPTVKTQIAYSSIAQMGLIFIEVAAGLHYLALLHFAGNAFLRTYQLLVSPSVLNYLVHDQFFNFAPRQKNGKEQSFKKLRYTIYILSVKEWNLDLFLSRFLWKPFKWVGNKLNFLTAAVSLVLLGLVFLSGLYLYAFEQKLPENIAHNLPLVFSFVGLLLILKAFTEKTNVVRGWLLIIFSQLFIAITISLNAHIDPEQLVLFLAGVILSGIVGYVCLAKIKQLEKDIDLNKFHGHVYEYPRLAFVFLLSCLGLLGFPVTTTFIGIDLFFTHIHEDQYVLIAFMAISVAFIELSVLRMYARVFLGQHTKAYHPIAFRSS